jgi:hypothetical protein
MTEVYGDVYLDGAEQVYEEVFLGDEVEMVPPDSERAWKAGKRSVVWQGPKRVTVWKA